MSTSGSMPRICKGPGRFVSAILIGALLALQCLLPSVAFARSSGRGAAFSSKVDINSLIRDRAGVSVVRLLASYSNDATPKGLANCTSLGILVASKSVGTAYQNWVLTDGSLINTTMQSNCTATGGSSTLQELQIWPSTEYNGTTIPTASQKLGDLTHCQQNTGAATCNDTSFPTVSETLNLFSENSVPYTLFAFQTQFPQPTLTLLGSTSLPAMPMLTIGLTNATGKTDTPTGTDPGTLLNFLQPTVLSNEGTSGALPSSPIPTPSGIAVPQNAPEGGTPVVDASGQLLRMLLNGGTSLESAKLQNGLQNAKVPLTSNPFTVLWDTGIAAFYAGNAPEYQLADNAFKQLSTLNPAFLAAKSFDTMALARLALLSPSPTKTSSSAPSGNILSQFSSSGPVLLSAAAVMVILLLIVILVLVLRTRKRRRELKLIDDEFLQSRSQAEAEVQNLRTQRPNTEVPCPNCHQAVRLGDTICLHCRYPLTPSASGMGLNIAGSGPLPPLQSRPYNPPPVVPSRSDVSEQPTLFFPPASGSGGEVYAEERTLIKHKNASMAQQAGFHTSGPYGHTLGLSVGTRSDPGLKRKHKPNEDSLFAMQGARTHNSQAEEFGLFVVADGMGGHANGQDASRQAIQTMIDFMLPRISSNEPMDDEAFTKLLGEGVQHANQAVHQRNMDVRADMGTTMTTSLIVGSTAYVANVGDSRTYLYREGQGLSKVTNDHSVVASLVEAGIIQPDDIYTHPKRNQIYRSLGEKPIVEVDTFRVDLQPGDILLLCSDGLWDMVRDPVIQQVLAQHSSDPNKTGQDLIKAALDGGGEDNVSVIVVQVTTVDQATGKTGIQLLAKPETVTLPKLPPV